MRTIFICYPREEGEDMASGRLAEDLRRHFGDEQVFRDQDSIAGGESWKKRVLSAIDKESAVLVLIGSHWLERRGERGRGLADPDYPMRMEIEDALRDDARLIPILMENAAMPRDDQFPESIRGMAERNALRLRASDWPGDLERILRNLEMHGFRPVSFESRTRASRAVLHGIPLKLVFGFGLMALATLGLFGAWEDITSAFENCISNPHTATGLYGVATFYAVGAVLCIFAYREFQRGLTRRGWPAIVGIVDQALPNRLRVSAVLDPFRDPRPVRLARTLHPAASALPDALQVGGHFTGRF